MKKILVLLTVLIVFFCFKETVHAKEVLKTEEIYVRTINRYDRLGKTIETIEEELDKKQYEEELSNSKSSTETCS